MAFPITLDITCFTSSVVLETSSENIFNILFFCSSYDKYGTISNINFIPAVFTFISES